VGCLWLAQPSLHADSPVEGGSHDVVSCAPTVQVDVRVPTAVCPLRSVPAARSIYSLAGSSKQYRHRPLSAFQCTTVSIKLCEHAERAIQAFKGGGCPDGSPSRTGCILPWLGSVAA
jgi:hypothetical protein